MNVMMFVYIIHVLVLYAASSFGKPRNMSTQMYLDNPSIQRLREYVQIDTSTSENLEQAVDFWRRQAQSIGLEFTVFRPAYKPICIISWPGLNPDLPSIMLNSHMDVVPAEPELWKYPPFSAHLDENGDIYGRGTQDDKDVAIQYIEAIRKLKQENVTLQRTLHITLMPDEETGGKRGMARFVELDFFDSMNVGFALDEGVPSSDDSVYVTYQDKRPWQIKFTVRGEAGHGGSVPDSTAMEKAYNVMSCAACLYTCTIEDLWSAIDSAVCVAEYWMQKLIENINAHRDEQRALKETREATDYGAYDSVNINILQGGYVPNVIPSKMSLVVDVRWAVHRNVDLMQRTVDSWLEGSNGTVVEYIRRVEQSNATMIDRYNLYWQTIKEALAVMEIKVSPVICPAASDMIFLRNLGIPALGFAPKIYTTNRIHGVDEYINAESFLIGIDIYVDLLEKLGNLEIRSEMTRLPIREKY